MTWKHEPEWTGTMHIGTLSNAPNVRQFASMDMPVAVGFGSAAITHDGALVYQEPHQSLWCEECDESLDIDDNDDLYCPSCGYIEPPIEYQVLEHFEHMAALDPDHDWRCRIHGPLSGHTYQRQGRMRWVMIESNPGFA